MTAPAAAPNYSCLFPPSFTGLTDAKDFLTQFEAVSTLSNWAALNPDPARISFLLDSPETPSLFTGPWPLLKKETTMNSSVSSSNNANLTPTFGRPKWSPSANYPAKMCPLSAGNSVTLQAKLIRRCRAQWAPPHHIHRRVGQFSRSVGSPKSQTNSG